MRSLEELSNRELKRKQEWCHRFGAEWFQKVVFGAESVKYTIIDHCFPNIRPWYDKRCEKMATKLCKKTDDPLEQQQIRKYYQEQMLLFRKELAQRKNRNYHFDKRDPQQTVAYLKQNKHIHRNGLIAGAVALGISGIGLLLPFEAFHGSLSVVFALSSVKCLIDMQCINLQNYNLCRLQRIMPRLKKLQEKQLELDAQNYGAVSHVVSRTMQNGVTIPSSQQVVANLSTKDQLLQMRNLLLESMAKQSTEKPANVKHYKKEEHL